MSDAAETPTPSAMSQVDLDDFTAKLVTALKTVYDPEIPVDIYELGLIYKVDVSDSKDIAVDMTLTAQLPCRRRDAGDGARGAGKGRRCGRRDGEHDLRSALDARPHERRSQARTEHVLRRMMETQTPVKPRRERPKPVRLTDAAAARIAEIMANAEGKYQGVRVGVTNGGCAGMSYVMDYAEEAKPFEEVMEEKGVKIFIDPKAILFLIGTEMDFVQEKLGARFVFNNPNQTAACGCGESVSITPASA
jgi:iron-sulfur cluster assembly protein